MVLLTFSSFLCQCTSTCTHARAHTHTHIHIHTNTHTHTHTHMYVHTVATHTIIIWKHVHTCKMHIHMVEKTETNSLPLYQIGILGIHATSAGVPWVTLIMLNIHLYT